MTAEGDAPYLSATSMQSTFTHLGRNVTVITFQEEEQAGLGWSWEFMIDGQMHRRLDRLPLRDEVVALREGETEARRHIEGQILTGLRR
jgi:hypothetical protein